MKRGVFLFFLVLLSCSKETSSPENSMKNLGGEFASIYPHSEEFKRGGHGSAFLKDRTLCTQCHTQTRKTSNSDLKAPSCAGCHYYPHAPGWALPTRHAAVFLDKNKKKRVSCSDCHSKRSRFAREHKDHYVACDACHLEMPHPKSVVEVDEDGSITEGDDHVDLARTYYGMCTRCHTDLKRNMPHTDGEGCLYCHAGEGKPIVQWLQEEEAKRMEKESKMRAVAKRKKRQLKENKSTPPRGVASEPDKE